MPQTMDVTLAVSPEYVSRRGGERNRKREQEKLGLRGGRKTGALRVRDRVRVRVRARVRGRRFRVRV